MDASKSTLHHHLMLLRAAGLVRVTIGVEKEYSLRDDVVPEATGVLQAYINQDTNGTSEEEST
jgi:DNA-binding transcriptional ArsR family regulator